MMLESRRGGGREGEKKMWQIFKVAWLHCGHVAAFTTTVWSNMTSPLSSASLTLKESILLSLTGVREENEAPTLSRIKL